MNITSKSRYALKIMIDLAEQAAGPVTHRSDMAARQGIPLDYMDHILSRLRDGQLVESVRGRGGGYRLTRSAQTISALEIFKSAEDSWHPVACLSDGAVGCVIADVCSTRDTWSHISDAISGTLSGILLSDLLGHRRGVDDLGAPMPDPKVQECRAPKRRLGGTRSL